MVAVPIYPGKENNMVNIENVARELALTDDENEKKKLAGSILEAAY